MTAEIWNYLKFAFALMAPTVPFSATAMTHTNTPFFCALITCRPPAQGARGWRGRKWIILAKCIPSRAAQNLQVILRGLQVFCTEFIVPAGWQLTHTHTHTHILHIIMLMFLVAGPGWQLNTFLTYHLADCPGGWSRCLGLLASCSCCSQADLPFTTCLASVSPSQMPLGLLQVGRLLCLDSP